MAIVVGHVVWFRYGWTDLPLRCVDHHWEEWREIYGELTPDAAVSFELLLKSLYGEAAVKRLRPASVMVRPAVVAFGDDGRLKDLTIMMIERFSGLSNSPDTGATQLTKDCRLAQHVLMASGQAHACDTLWQTWLLYGRVSQEDTPWLTRVFQVEQPHPGQMYNLPLDTLPRPAHALAEADSLNLPEGIKCGPSKSHLLFFGPVVVLAELSLIAESLWPL